MGITLAIFIDFENIPFSKDRFIKFARGTLMVLSNTFKSFVDILFSHLAFLRLNVFIKDCSLSGYVGVRKNVFLRGLLRKSEYFLSVFTILLFIFLVIDKELIKVITYYKWVSCLLIIYFKTVCLFSFFVYVYNKLDSVLSFKHILFVFMKMFLIMISFANFSEFVYSILVCFKLIV